MISNSLLNIYLNKRSLCRAFWIGRAVKPKKSGVACWALTVNRAALAPKFRKQKQKKTNRKQDSVPVQTVVEGSTIIREDNWILSPTVCLVLRELGRVRGFDFIIR